MTGMLTHWDPQKFPSLEEMLGEGQKHTPQPAEDGEPRANAAAWIAVMYSWNRKAGVDPAAQPEKQEVEDG
jgi:hypothetical protein